MQDNIIRHLQVNLELIWSIKVMRDKLKVK